MLWRGLGLPPGLQPLWGITGPTQCIMENRLKTSAFRYRFITSKLRVSRQRASLTNMHIIYLTVGLQQHWPMTSLIHVWEISMKYVWNSQQKCGYSAPLCHIIRYAVEMISMQCIQPPTSLEEFKLNFKLKKWINRIHNPKNVSWQLAQSRYMKTRRQRPGVELATCWIQV